MDSIAMVGNQIEDGQRLIDELIDKGIDIRAACWIKRVEPDRWSLYIATPLVDEKGEIQAYRQVFQVLGSLQDLWFTSSDVVIIGAKHPLARAVSETRRRFSGRTLTRVQNLVLGDVFAEEACIYTLGKTPVPIYGLVYRGEPRIALHLSFEPHNPHSKVIVENMGERNEYPAETGIDWVVAAPEGAKLERNHIGLLELAWEDLHGNRNSSSANEVWSLAKLGLQGFRFLEKPERVGV